MCSRVFLCAPQYERMFYRFACTISFKTFLVPSRSRVLDRLNVTWRSDCSRFNGILKLNSMAQEIDTQNGCQLSERGKSSANPRSRRKRSSRTFYGWFESVESGLSAWAGCWVKYRGLLSHADFYGVFRVSKSDFLLFYSRAKRFTTSNNELTITGTRNECHLTTPRVFQIKCFSFANVHTRQPPIAINSMFIENSPLQSRSEDNFYWWG